MAYSLLHRVNLTKPSIYWIVFLVLVFQLALYILYIRPSLNCQTNIINSTNLQTVNHNPNDSDCLCSGENFCFKAMDDNGNVVYGRKFDCRFYSRLKEAKLLDSDAKEATNDFDNLNATDWVPTFLTVVSRNHYGESKPMIQNVFKHYPTARVIYYDAGLTDEQATEIKKLPNVEYRKFNFSAYPAHVPNLKTYAFKLAQIEVFQQHKTFYYVDASVRIRSKLDHLVGVQKQELPPIITFTATAHSVYATVHPEMLGYFPLSKTVLYAIELEANSVFFSDSLFTRYAFKWWFLCAMTPECIAPMGAAVTCKVWNYKDIVRTYINCHRFDQAYFNIITLAYMFGEYRAALDYKYVANNWTTITSSIINEFQDNRMKHINHYGRHFGIDRWKET